MAHQLSASEMEELQATLSAQGAVRLVPAGDLAIKSMHDLPHAWRHVLADRDAAPFNVIAHWSKLLDLLPRTLVELERCLHDVALVFGLLHGPALLYVFRQSDDILGQLGYMPASPSEWHGIPEWPRALLQEFYTIHDGWIDLYAGDGGPLPVSEWQAINVPEGAGSSLLVTYADGGHFVGHAVEYGVQSSYVLWPEDDAVEKIESFWRHVDERLAASLEDCDGRDDYS